MTQQNSTTLNPLGVAIAELIKIEAAATKEAQKQSGTDSMPYTDIANRAAYVINRLCIGNTKKTDDLRSEYAALELFKEAVRVKESDNPDELTLKRLDAAYRHITGVPLFEYQGTAEKNSNALIIETLATAASQAEEKPEATRKLIASAVHYLEGRDDDSAGSVQYRRWLRHFEKSAVRH